MEERLKLIKKIIDDMPMEKLNELVKQSTNNNKNNYTIKKFLEHYDGKVKFKNFHDEFKKLTNDEINLLVFEKIKNDEFYSKFIKKCDHDFCNNSDFILTLIKKRRLCILFDIFAEERDGGHWIISDPIIIGDDRIRGNDLNKLVIELFIYS